RAALQGLANDLVSVGAVKVIGKTLQGSSGVPPRIQAGYHPGEWFYQKFGGLTTSRPDGINDGFTCRC
ncbi:hypothetical protein, partial [Streptomyces anulatus]|uniref:hypothetical protein n=1 Tax=Streptomyces anulatus TaxID=1892 RepID=UPI0019446B88